MKAIIFFILLWCMSTLALVCVKGASKATLYSFTKALLFGLATATIASVVLTLIVYVF